MSDGLILVSGITIGILFTYLWDYWAKKGNEEGVRR